VRYDWGVEIKGVDVSDAVKAGGTIDYGKPSTFTGFQAPTAVFELLTKDQNPNPAPAVWPAIALGDPVIIHVTHTGTVQHRRFTGIVQAIDYSLYSIRVTATGNGTDWGRSWTGATGSIYPISVQNDSTRMAWLVSEAGKTVTIEGAPARWVREIPKNTAGTILLDAALRVADDCDGLLLEDRLGVMRYRTRNFTRPARTVIPPHLVESTSLDMVIERGTLINSVSVYYGEPDPATGLQASVYGIDNASVSEYGEHRAELYTDLQYELGAGGKAQKFLEKNRLGWQVPDATLVMSQATPEDADYVLDLQENWRVALSPLPEGCPIGAFDGDILGFTEIMHPTDYRIILHLGLPIGDEGSPPEVPVFPADSVVGGTTYTYEDQFAFQWQVHEWDTPGDYTATVAHEVLVDALIVGGGGGGGQATFYNHGGGGGAGALLERVLPLTPGTIAVAVGAGGVGGIENPYTNATPGGTSKFAGAWCYGGGYGGGGGTGGGTMPAGIGNPGGPGGFGGGGGALLAAGGAGTYGSLDGGVTTNTTDVLGGAGQTIIQGNYAGNGGGATYASEITGTVVTYARPGTGGAPWAVTTDPGSGGPGGLARDQTAGKPGNAGTVIVRYRIG
jgi:hypothetical protein